MIENIFEDNGKAVVDINRNEVFSYSFSSDAHIISENIENYRYATETEAILLNYYLKKRKLGQDMFFCLGPKFIEYEEMTNDTVIITDRQRTVIYNDIGELQAMRYGCNNCKEYYIMEAITPYFCKKCGIKFRYIVDVSA